MALPFWLCLPAAVVGFSASQLDAVGDGVGHPALSVPQGSSCSFGSASSSPCASHRP